MSDWMYGEYSYRDELIDDIRDVQRFLSDDKRAWNHVPLQTMSVAQLEGYYISVCDFLWRGDRLVRQATNDAPIPTRRADEPIEHPDVVASDVREAFRPLSRYHHELDADLLERAFRGNAIS